MDLAFSYNLLNNTIIGKLGLKISCYVYFRMNDFIYDYDSPQDVRL